MDRIIQIDVCHDQTGQTPDAEGDHLAARLVINGVLVKPIRGASCIRVLAGAGVSAAQAVRLLRKIADWVEEEPHIIESSSSRPMIRARPPTSPRPPRNHETASTKTAE